MKHIFTLLTCLTILLLTSCGYNLGSTGHPEINTIAISPINNETYYPNVSTYMRNALSEAFQVDGAYKIRNVYHADCILYGTIKDIKLSAKNIETSLEGSTFITRVFSMNLTFEFTVIIPGQTTPFIRTTKIAKSIQYQVPLDQFKAQENALKQAAWQTAKQVVQNCTEF